MCSSRLVLLPRLSFQRCVRCIRARHHHDDDARERGARKAHNLKLIILFLYLCQQRHHHQQTMMGHQNAREMTAYNDPAIISFQQQLCVWL